ncbi:hypothetical protein GCM10009557_96720 [Virgisporangium ochraceum]
MPCDPSGPVTYVRTFVSGNRDIHGSAGIGDRLRARPPALTVCGHVRWERPLARLGDGQVLNVDGRVVALVAP